jgi:DNA modification methylase
MSDLFQNHVAKSGPVECLGQMFPDDEARREHYMKLLAEKLKDPAFRNIEGFPIGSDENILALSDPPYYTACPNPFLEDFVRHFGSPYDSAVSYNKEPFAADVSEGKNDPIYNAHSYHTKVPHKAIMRYILHYTQPGDIVLDGFCGTGMTGIAAQLCGDQREVESLGYKVNPDGTVFEEQAESGKKSWIPFSRLGKRVSVLNDLSPAASFIAYNYTTPVDLEDFERHAKRILAETEKEFGWLYQTTHTDGASKGKINFTVWSDVFNCPECAGEIVFWDTAVDRIQEKALEEFNCPHCSALMTKRKLDRTWTTHFDADLGVDIKQTKQIPVLINYSIGSKRFEKRPDASDLEVIQKSLSHAISSWIPTNLIQDGDKTSEVKRLGITHAHHLYTRRNLIVLSALREKIAAVDPKYLFWFTSALTWVGKENRLHLGNYFGGGGGVITSLRGTWYVASLSVETSVLERFSLRTRALKVRESLPGGGIVTCGSMSSTTIPRNSLDYIFVDPPFGSNLMYSELNIAWESWLGLLTNSTPEAIENKSQKKGGIEYRHLMLSCFKSAYAALKPGRWMTVEFSNTQAYVWNLIQTSLQEAGFVVANVSVLNKGKGSFNAVNNATSVKQDLVISAYKPDGDLEDRFAKSGGGEDSVWDFARTHLRYLPIAIVKNYEMEFVTERDPRIIFDRMVAWFVRHNTPVPMSTQEFQAGLVQRFIQRDGMVFLPDQVSEYDKKRLQVAIAPQMEMFVSDERSAIDWLSDFLKRRPSTYQEITPEFMGQLGAGWKKHEAKPELSALLEDNFLKYDGIGEVPSQIHAYLSSNHKDQRNLDKNDPALIAKAKDRWYVPDPNKAQDLEKKREKALLKEFDTYRSFTGRKIKESRLEVLRAGFRAAWAAKEYQTIINIANKLPEETLQEDEKLLTLYDMALTRTEDGL